jgi:hypothetical protein
MLAFASRHNIPRSASCISHGLTWISIQANCSVVVTRLNITIQTLCFYSGKGSFLASEFQTSTTSDLSPERTTEMCPAWRDPAGVHRKTERILIRCHVLDTETEPETHSTFFYSRGNTQIRINFSSTLSKCQNSGAFCRENNQNGHRISDQSHSAEPA